jgi:hypothetical protein
MVGVRLVAVHSDKVFIALVGLGEHKAGEAQMDLKEEGFWGKVIRLGEAVSGRFVNKPCDPFPFQSSTGSRGRVCSLGLLQAFPG